MSQETMNMNISLDKTLPIVCEKCGGETFTQVLFLRKVSKFLAGTAQDGLIPIPSFACNSCQHINEEFKPNTNDQE
jgi:hypothetical protein